MSVELFYSYAHEDEALRDELEKHLSPLRRQGLVTSWHDRQLTAGQTWMTEIDTHVNSADIILLLVSPDFIASDYCDYEMKTALARHNKGALVIPVILRPVDWSGAPFGHLQVLPRNGTPVTSWPNRDDAFKNVAEGIRKVVDEHVTSTSSVGHVAIVQNADVAPVALSPAATKGRSSGTKAVWIGAVTTVAGAALLATALTLYKGRTPSSSLENRPVAPSVSPGPDAAARALWEKNWQTINEPGFTSAMGANGRSWINKAQRLQILRALDLSTTPELAQKLNHLIRLLESAETNPEQTHWNTLHTAEMEEAESDLKRAIRGRAIDHGVNVALQR